MTGGHTNPSSTSSKSLRPSTRTDVRDRTSSRQSTILPSFVGVNFSIYNGHKFVPLRVTQDTVGHKFGEFSLTRKGKNLYQNKQNKKSGPTKSSK